MKERLLVKLTLYEVLPRFPFVANLWTDLALGFLSKQADREWGIRFCRMRVKVALRRARILTSLDL